MLYRAFIAGQPKSASTHLVSALIRYTGAKYEMCNYYKSQGVEAQDVNADMLYAQVAERKSYIYKQHLLPNPNSVLTLMNAKLPIIVTYRNIPDTIASLYDAFEKYYDYENNDGPFPMPIGLPIRKEWWREWDMEQKLDVLVNFYGPWFALFHRGWKEVPDVFLIEYNEFMAEKLWVFEDLITWLKWSWDGEKAVEALNVKDVRHNKVRPGRGAEYLNERQLGHLSSLTSGLE